MFQLIISSLCLLFIFSFAHGSGLFEFAPTHGAAQKNPSITRHYTLHYQNSRLAASILNDRKLHYLSPHGHLHISRNGHDLWVSDDNQHVKQLDAWLSQYDHPTSSVLIQARIVSIDNDASSFLGTLFQTHSVSPPRLEAQISHAVFPLAHLKGGYLLDVAIDALEQKGHATLISKPELMTLDRVPASIESGESIPYQENTLSGATSIAFKKAVLRLNVTPFVLSKQALRLKIRVNQDTVSGLSINGTPAIHTQSLNTTAILNSGQTLMLGGIIEQKESKIRVGIPLLSKLPILGRIFQHQQKKYSKRELLIFITPRLIR